MIRGNDFILNPNKLEEQFQLVEVSDWVDFTTKCSLRPLAVANAFFNGRYAEQNGRSYLVDC